MLDATQAQASIRAGDAAVPVAIQALASKRERAWTPAAASKVAASAASPALPAVVPIAIPVDPQVVDGSPVAAVLQDDSAVVDSVVAVPVWIPALGETPAAGGQAARPAVADPAVADPAVADPAVDGSPDDSTVVASAAFPVLVAILEPVVIPEKAAQVASAHRAPGWAVALLPEPV
jgi:hypothetical protein